jgi:predicted small integral membrane protein
MEPQWTKKISSETICSVYWYIYVIYAIVAVLAIVGTIGILVSFKLPKALAVSVGFQGLLVAVIGATLALFQYLVCDRALLAGKAKQSGEGFSAAMMPEVLGGL